MGQIRSTFFNTMIHLRVFQVKPRYTTKLAILTGNRMMNHLIWGYWLNRYAFRDAQSNQKTLHAGGAKSLSSLSEVGDP